MSNSPALNYYYRNRDKQLEMRAKYYAENKEKIKKKTAEYFKEYYTKNREQMIKRVAEYTKKILRRIGNHKVNGDKRTGNIYAYIQKIEEIK